MGEWWENDRRMVLKRYLSSIIHWFGARNCLFSATEHHPERNPPEPHRSQDEKSNQPTGMAAITSSTTTIQRSREWIPKSQKIEVFFKVGRQTILYDSRHLHEAVVGRYHMKSPYLFYLTHDLAGQLGLSEAVRNDSKIFEVHMVQMFDPNSRVKGSRNMSIQLPQSLTIIFMHHKSLKNVWSEVEAPAALPGCYRHARGRWSPSIRHQWADTFGGQKIHCGIWLPKEWSDQPGCSSKWF